MDDVEDQIRGAPLSCDQVLGEDRDTMADKPSVCTIRKSIRALLLAKATGEVTSEDITNQVHKLIAENPWIVSKIRHDIEAVIGKDGLSAVLQRFIADKPMFIHRHYKLLKKFFSFDQLRTYIFACYARFPSETLGFYTQYAELFTDQYFEELVSDGVDLLSDERYVWIFKLKYCTCRLEELSVVIREYLESKLERIDRNEFVLGARREPGFACGGLEANCYHACYHGTAARVNDLVLAQNKHRKDHAADKAAYWFKNDFISGDNVFFKDFFYMPSKGQEKVLIAGRGAAVQLETLYLRPVRPMLKVTSGRLFEVAESQHPDKYGQ